MFETRMPEFGLMQSSDSTRIDNVWRQYCIFSVLSLVMTDLSYWYVKIIEKVQGKYVYSKTMYAFLLVFLNSRLLFDVSLLGLFVAGGLSILLVC
jgi:hypothetical protein